MTLTTIILGASALALAAPAAASQPGPGAEQQPVVVMGQPEAATITRRVSYADLDLAAAKDRKILHRRVDSAIRNVCLEATGPNPLDWAEYACRRGAWIDAKSQMALAMDRAPQLAATGHSAIAPAAILISVASR